MICKRKTAHAGLLLAALLIGCRPRDRGNTTAGGAEADGHTSALNDVENGVSTGHGPGSAAATNSIVCIQDVMAFEQALAGKEGSISNALAAQLAHLECFRDKQIAVAGAVRRAASQTEAVACATQLVNAAATPQERCLALCDLGYVYMRFKDFNAATGMFGAMTTCIPDDAEYAQAERYSAYRGLTMTHMMHGNYGGQLTWAEAALAAAQQTGNREYIEAALDEVAMELINTRQFEAAKQIIQERLRNDPGKEFVKQRWREAKNGRSPVILTF